MTIPKLKRLKISSANELRMWLAKNLDQPTSVMVVTNTNAASTDHVSRQEVADSVSDHGWTTGPRFTLNGNLLGHVISPKTV